VAGVRRCFQPALRPGHMPIQAGFPAALRRQRQLDDLTSPCCAQPPAGLISIRLMCRQADQRGIGRAGSTTATSNQQRALPPAAAHLRDLLQRASAGDPKSRWPPTAPACTAAAAPAAAVRLGGMIVACCCCLPSRPCWWACSLRWIAAFPQPCEGPAFGPGLVARTWRAGSPLAGGADYAGGLCALVTGLSLPGAAVDGTLAGGAIFGLAQGTCWVVRLHPLGGALLSSAGRHTVARSGAAQLQRPAGADRGGRCAVMACSTCPACGCGARCFVLLINW